MRLQVEVIGKGFNEKQAKVSAYNDLKAQYKNNVLVYGMLSCQQVKAPKVGTQCETKNFPVQGARKWVTKHNLYAENPSVPNDWKKVESLDSKTDAVKKGKELALQYQQDFHVKVEKQLEDDQNIEAIIKPKAATPGEWKIVLDVEAIS